MRRGRPFWGKGRELPGAVPQAAFSAGSRGRPPGSAAARPKGFWPGRGKPGLPNGRVQGFQRKPVRAGRGDLRERRWAPPAGLCWKHKTVPSVLLNTALIKSKHERAQRKPARPLKKGGRSGMLSYVVRLSIAVLSGLSLVQGRRVVRTLRPAAFMFPDPILIDSCRKCKGYPGKNGPRRKNIPPGIFCCGFLPFTAAAGRKTSWTGARKPPSEPGAQRAGGTLRRKWWRASLPQSRRPSRLRRRSGR